MTVRDAVHLISCGQAFIIKGAYSGKVYHKSYRNKNENLKKYLDEEVVTEPFFTDLYTLKRKDDLAYTYPIIGIWMRDYDICKPEQPKEET